jgi:hypothetical protein
VDDAVEEIFRILCQHHRHGLTAAESTFRLLMNRVPPELVEEAMRVIALTGGQRIRREGARLMLGPEWREEHDYVHRRAGLELALTTLERLVRSHQPKEVARRDGDCSAA